MPSVQRPRGDYIPSCPHYPEGCVGCPFINLPYPERLKRKQQIVAQAFARILSASNRVEVTPSVWSYLLRQGPLADQRCENFRLCAVATAGGMRKSRRSNPTLQKSLSCIFILPLRRKAPH